MTKQRPVDLRDTGLLWLINRVVFHPRGYALAYDPDDKAFSLLGDGREPWSFGEASDEVEALDKIRELMP